MIINNNKNKQLRVVSLFSGIGGFEEGLLKSHLHDLDVEFASEIDNFAKKSFLSNFPNIDVQGDITQVSEQDIPNHDLLIGGFPCQAFSVAGKQDGFLDTRGTLFFDIERILKVKNPKYVLLENVKNLISHDAGKTINIILKSLSDMDYTVDFTVINSLEAGLPQNRERTYILGIKNHKKESFEQDFRNNKINQLKMKLNFDNFNSFNFFNDIKFSRNPIYLENILEEHVDEKYFYNKEQMTNYLSKLSINLPTNNEARILKVLDIPREVHNDHERQRRVYSVKGISPTLLARSDTTKIIIKVNDQLRIRKITPTESLRIQGFSEEFISNIKATNMSDTQLYKQAGNAVSPPVIKKIANHLSYLIKEESYESV